MNVVGLDLSLTSTGVATQHGTYVIAVKEKGVERLAHLRSLIDVDALGADVVVIEGYAYNKGLGAHQAGELGGVVRLLLHEHGVAFTVVAPATLKLYATGKGGGKDATKEAVLASAIRRLGYEGSSTDEADALWLYAMAKDHYGEPLCEMPKAHRAALEKVYWPVLANSAQAAASA